MKLNGGTRPFSSSLTSNSLGSGTRGGLSGRLTVADGSSFFSPSPCFFFAFFLGFRRRLRTGLAPGLRSGVLRLPSWPWPAQRSSADQRDR